jgi:hypothetical protein
MNKKGLIFFCNCFLFLFFSCQEKAKYGDFTLLTQKDKYESLGGILKSDGYTLEYKGNKIDWSSINTLDDPNIEQFDFLSDKKNMLVEVKDSYYLLIPNGENVTIKFLAEAGSRSGAFTSKPYTELLKNDDYFHQAGLLINLQTFKRDTATILPPGRLLATDEKLTKIIYLDGIFDNDTNLKKTSEQYNFNSGAINFNISTNYSDVNITEWDVTKNTQTQYSYSDTTMWQILDNYYKENRILALSKSCDTSIVYALFKWNTDSIGNNHLIPKGTSLAAIKFIGLKK